MINEEFSEIVNHLEYLNQELELESGTVAVRVTTRILEGKSGAGVYRVDVKSNMYSGAAILKIQKAIKWSDDTLLEHERFKQLSEKAPSFVKSYCPELIWAGCYEEDQMYLMNLAGQSLLQMGPLKGVTGDKDRKGVLHHIVNCMLSDFQEGGLKIKHFNNPTVVLKNWLGYRLEKGGTIETFLKAKGMESDATNYTIDGVILPNPLAFCLEPKLWRAPSLPKVGFVGRLHGDLHEGNVLVRKQHDETWQLSIIDMALYEESKYLFYDTAYLEYSMLSRFLANHTESTWRKLLQQVTEGGLEKQFGYDMLAPADAGIVKSVSAIGESIEEFAATSKALKNRVDERVFQVNLARVAVGLNFINKAGLTDKERCFALIFASVFLQKILDPFSIKWNTQKQSQGENPPAIITKSNDNWSDAYERLDRFQNYTNTYVLISDGHDIENITDVAFSALGKVPWHLIIDFDVDSATSGRLENSLSPHLKNNRSLHLLMPENERELRSINYENATLWLLANGRVDIPNTICHTFKSWRQKYKEFIREAAQRVLQGHKFEPIKLLCVVNNIDQQRLIRTLEVFEELYDEYFEIIVLSSDISVKDAFEEFEKVHFSNCSFSAFCEGLLETYGPEGASDEVLVPFRKTKIDANEGGQTRTVIQLDISKVKWMEEDFQIVHSGLLDQENPDQVLQTNFLKGHEITWNDINRNHDIKREITNDLKQELLIKLSESSNVTKSFYHNAGAGGTTVAKRIAWEVKGRFPTVMLKKYSVYTTARLGYLFSQTNLPIFVVIDTSVVSPSEREILHNSLKQDNTRAVLLNVQRISKQRSAKSHVLTDSMTYEEAKSFLAEFSTLAPTKERILRNLLNSENAHLRSPFFFGLFSYEDKYQRLPDYVKLHLVDLKPELKSALIYTAMVTRFTQSLVPEWLFRLLIGIKSPNSREPTLQRLDSKVKKLIKKEKLGIRIVHPKIGEQILKEYLEPRVGNSNEKWTLFLHDYAVEFIEFLDGLAESTGIDILDQNDLLELIQSLFITRDVVQDDDHKSKFSDLVTTINSEETQLELFNKLTELIPNEAHLWNHKARLLTYVIKEPYHNSIECLEKAIDLEPDNHLHYHMMGMVYRVEIKDQIIVLKQDKRAEGEQSEINELTVFEELQGLYEQADICFNQARDINQDNEYGYITHIQLTLELIEGMRGLSGVEHFEDFLKKDNKAVKWSTELYSKAHELLEKVKLVQRYEDFSTYTSICEQSLLKLGRNHDALISILESALVRHDDKKEFIRRSMSSTLMHSFGRSWQNVTEDKLAQVLEWTSSNHRAGLASDYDYQMWVKAYLRHSGFTFSEALIRLEKWKILHESIEAYYFQFILYFLQYHRGDVATPERALANLQVCRERNRMESRGNYSFYWYSRTPGWCNLKHRSELGKWDKIKEFYQSDEKLKKVSGVIKSINGRQSGSITIGPFEAFFVPKDKFLPGSDLNRKVLFYLGFSYDGLRAWNVEPDES
ncbi:MAG: hypothetical protein HEP71_23260 [Roseivirga sp.]|nr:hypothetical protein [Roseivirga sp.]